MAIRTVGFVGLGAMGDPICRNILKNGSFAVRAFDVRREAVERMARLGATGCGSAAEAAADADLICTIVPDSPQVEQVILGPGGVLEGARPAALIAEMSTIDPGVTQAVAEKVRAAGVRMIDTPVCRSTAHAERAELMFLGGGAEADFQEALPVLKCSGDTFHYCGPSGMGITMKLVNNMMGQGIAVAICEALSLGVKAGLDRDLIVKIVLGTAAASKFLEQAYCGKALKGDFEPGFALKHAHKDVGHALRAAARLGVPCPAASMAHMMQNIALTRGKGDWDHTALATVFEELAGVALCDGNGKR